MTDCEKHGRLIVAVLNVDTPDEKGFCVGCIEEMHEAMTEFVERVEKGEVRSKYTYNKFKSILKTETVADESIMDINTT